MHWLVDGNNVMGSRPDGWWNDRPAAMERLTQEIAEWCWTHEDEVTLVFDGRTVLDVADMSGGNLQVQFSARTGRNAADDVIVELAAQIDSPITVITADKGLIARLDEAARTEGPGSFLTRIAERPAP